MYEVGNRSAVLLPRPCTLSSIAWVMWQTQTRGIGYKQGDRNEATRVNVDCGLGPVENDLRYERYQDSGTKALYLSRYLGTLGTYRLRYSR